MKTCDFFFRIGILFILLVLIFIKISGLHAAEAGPVYNFTFTNDSASKTQTPADNTQAMKPQLKLRPTEPEKRSGVCPGFVFSSPIKETMSDDTGIVYFGFNLAFQLPFTTKYSIVPQMFYTWGGDTGFSDYYKEFSSTMYGLRLDIRGDHHLNRHFAFGGGFSALVFHESSKFTTRDNSLEHMFDENKTYLSKTSYGGGLFFGPNMTFGRFNIYVNGRVDYLPEYTSVITGNTKDIITWGLGLNLGIKI